MADSHAKQHDYHLVDPSPWPFIGATGALIMLFAGVLLLQEPGVRLLRDLLGQAGA